MSMEPRTWREADGKSPEGPPHMVEDDRYWGKRTVDYWLTPEDKNYDYLVWSVSRIIAATRNKYYRLGQMNPDKELEMPDAKSQEPGVY